MFFTRIASLFLLLCTFMVTLSSCTIFKSLASETDVILTTEGNTPRNASITEPSYPTFNSNDSGTSAENTIIVPPPTATETVPEEIARKGLYSVVYVNELLSGLTLRGDVKAAGTAMLTLQDGAPRIDVTLSNGTVVSMQFSSDDTTHQNIYMSAGDLDHDGYDELVVYLGISDSGCGSGVPIVLKAENGALVALSSPLDYIYAASFPPFDKAPESDFGMCNGAVVINKGALRLTSEYQEYNGDEHFHMYYDFRKYNDNDGWFVIDKGITAVNEAAGYISYKEEIVALHNDRVKNSQWFNDIDITDIVTRQVRKGNLSENGEATVILFEVKLSGALWPHYPVYIIEDAEGRIIWYWGDFFEAAPYTSCFYLNDIDGDGYCEIISQHDSGGNGGFGGYYSYIFKVVNRSLEQLFPSEIQDWFIFDTGFTLSLYDGFHFTINNKFVPFEMTFTRERYDTPYFDNYGSVTCTIDRSEDEMMVDSFYIFTPVDFDNDGVYEIMTAQYCSLWGHSDGIGTAYTILKYDNISGEMRVIKAGFWEYLDDSFNETDYDAHNNEQWLLYEQNWYKKME